jgi:hypothetical protein
MQGGIRRIRIVVVVEQIRHAADVVEVRVGGNEQPDLPLGPGRLDQVLAVDLRSVQRVEQARQLSGRCDVDDHQPPQVVVAVWWQQQQLGVAVTDVDQEVDEGVWIGGNGVDQRTGRHFRVGQTRVRNLPDDRRRGGHCSPICCATCGGGLTCSGCSCSSARSCNTRSTSRCASSSAAATG